MTAPRFPRFAGVAGGCATTTLSTALGGIDAHVYRGKGRVDVLVCRPTMSSLSEAQVALAAMASRPVLAVVADMPRAVSSAARARLRLTEPHTAEVVHVPFVPQLRQLDQARAHAAITAWWSEDQPRWLREFTEAMTDLVDAVLPLLQTPHVAAAQRAARPASEVQDDLRARDGGPQPAAAQQVGAHVLDAVRRRPGVPAERPHLAARPPQPGPPAPLRRGR